MQGAQTPPRPRQWTIEADGFGGLDEEQLLMALSECAVILSRVGGAIKAMAVRQELDPEEFGEGNYVTTHLVLRWESYAPAQKFKPSDNGVETPAEEPAHHPV